MKAIKFNRKLNRLKKAPTPKEFSKLIIEGRTLLMFMVLDEMSKGRELKEIIG